MKLPELLGAKLKDPLGLFRQDGNGALAGIRRPQTAPADLPAGMRNKNPGNIKYDADVAWNGLVGPSENTDQGDAQAVFASEEAGMRAAYKLARNKYADGKITANQLIAGDGGWTPGYKPAAENIARMMGVGPDDDLRLDDPTQARKFLRALVTQEHGKASNAYSDEMIARTIAATDRERPDDGVAGNPQGKGMARLAPPEKITDATAFLTQRLVGKSSDHVSRMTGDLQDRLAALFQSAPPEIAKGLGIYSGFRSETRQAELWEAALKKYGSAKAARKWVAPPGSSNHNHGTAADLAYNGQSLRHAPKEVVQWVHANAGQFGLKFPLAHENWHVEVAETRGGKPARPMTEKQAAASGGKSGITIDRAFETRDPMGLFRGRDNPFTPMVGAAQAEMGQSSPLIDEDPDEDAMDVLARLEADAPGRYEAIDEAQYEAWRQNWEQEQPGIIEDMARVVGGSVIKGVGHLVQGIGAAARFVGTPTVTDIINPIFGTDYQPSNPLQVPSEWVAKYGEGVQQGVSQATRDALAQSTPDGDLFSPSTWTLGEKPSLTGYTALGLDVFGSLLPVVAASVLTGPVGGALVGGAQGGGAAERQAHDIIDAMAQQEGVLERESAYFREQIAAGRSREEAIAATKDAAGQIAFLFTAPISAIGGAATGKLLDPATKVLAGQNIVARIGGRAALSGLEEGAQEVAETIATRAGVNKAAGTDVSTTEGTFGDFVLGAIGGTTMGAPAGALSQQETAAPQDLAQAPDMSRKGPLARALEYGAGRGQGARRFTVNDPAVEDMGAGELHGQTVTMAPDQTNAPAGMVRVIDGAGETRIIGDRLLNEEAPQPLGQGRPVQPGEPKATKGKQASAPEPDAKAALKHDPALPPVKSTVRVAVPGMEPFEGTVESHVDGEALVFDTATGEVLQVEPEFITPLAPPPDADLPPPAEPKAAETKVERAPADELVPAGKRPYPPVKPGDNVVVDPGDGAPFNARVESFEDGNEALVTKEDGTSVQVPAADIKVSKLTPKQAEAAELERNPPVAREATPATPTDRKVFDATVTMPDERHARLYDLGQLRQQARRFEKGRGGLIADEAARPAQQKLADEFGISYEAAGQMADDYRHRAERAARGRRSDLPIKLHPLDDRHLKQWQAERRAAERDAAAGLDPATWWDGELSAEQRSQVLASAGIKRSEKTRWSALPKSLQDRLWKARAVAPPAAEASGIVPASTETPAASTDSGEMTSAAAPVDTAAAEAATSPENALPEPTEAQKEAGNYRKGHVRLGGLDISIENPAGSTRSGTDRSGKPWSVEMQSHYGYIRRTEGRDGDHVDVFVRPGTDTLDPVARAFVVDQVDPRTGRFDEHKIMLGFGSREEAEAAYRANYAKGWNGLGALTDTSVAEFKEWLEGGDTTQPFAEPGNDDVTVGLSADGPWDFNDVYPEPDRAKAEGLAREGRESFDIDDGGQFDPDEVSSVIEETMNELIVRELDIRDGEEQLAALDRGVPPKKGVSPEQARKRLTDAIAADRAAIDDIRGALVDQWSEKAADAIVAASRDRATQQSSTDKAPRVPREQRQADRAEPASHDPVGFYRAAHAEADRRWPPRVETTGKGKSQQTNRYVPHEHIAFTNGAQGYDALMAMPIHVTLADVADAYAAGAAWREGRSPEPSAPAPKAKEPAQTKADPFAGNKLFTADKVAAARARLKSKMGQINSGIDPEVLIDGMTIAGAYIEAGVRKFSDYAARMVEDFGEGVKPYLLSFWEGARNYPGLDTAGMTDVAESARLHRDLNKVLPASAAPALGSEVAAPKKRTVKTGKASDRTLTQDYGVEHIDAYSTEGEAAKVEFLKDGMAYLRAVADVLMDEGFTPQEDRRGKAMKPVSKNEAGIAVSGDVTMTLRHPETGANVYASLGGSALRGVVPTTPSGVALMFRVSKQSGDTFAARGTNRWMATTLSAADFAAIIRKEAGAGIPNAEMARPATESGNGRAEELDRVGQGSLEGAPAEAVQEPQRGRNARRQPDGGGEADLFGGRGAGEQRVQRRGGVADDARAVSDPAGRGAVDDDGASGLDSPKQNRSARDAGGSEARPALDAVELARDAGVTPAQDRATDYTITDADEIGAGGAKTKFKGNVAAIRVLRAIEAENRPATREEQAALAKWVGWGGLPQAFRRPDGLIAKGWDKEVAELADLLSDEEMRAAEQSTRNAHYTAPEVVKAIWSIADRLGFSGGQVLEPSVGAGNFIGLMPAALKQSARITGVELETVTGGIAKALYPHAAIRVQGFQTLTVPDGWFDLAVGNPPFGSEKLYDAERRHLNQFSIHNYFFAKSIEALRPGGVLAMVVTSYFLDAQDSRARRFIAERADLVGAIRLPNNAFLKNAGTEVTTDIIVLQKRPEGAPPSSKLWTDVGEITDAEGRKVPLNKYFVSKPEMMLGEFGAYGTMYSGEEPALVARPGDDLPDLLAAAMAKLPQSIMPAPAVAPVIETAPANAAQALVGSAFLSPNGELWTRIPDHVGEPQAQRLELASEKARERVIGMVKVRDAFTALRRAQVDERSTDAAIEGLRKELNTAYDAFVKANGPINADANKRLFRDDPTWPQVAALETDFDKGVSDTIAKKTGEAARAPSAKKAAIFTKRTQQPYRRPDKASSAKDALSIVLADRGRVDIAEMARLYGKDEDAIVAELGPLLYRAPDGAWQTADHYLSGNVKQKLAEAERAARQDPAFERNVTALRDVIPADIEAVDIDVKPGVPWVPARHVAAFADHITQSTGAKAVYSRTTAAWTVAPARSTASAETQWGTDRVSVGSLLEAVMNGKAVTVYDRDPDGTSRVNHAASEAAAEKGEKLKAEWRRWIFEDDARRDELTRIYNDTYNTDVVRRFDGSHLSLPGKVSDDIIELRPHQKNAVWRALQSSTTLFDHVVGAGKTFAVVASVMEMRRTGQARKPVVVVPNHLVGQWAADFIKLYPGAKILAATKKDFEAENRKKLFARAASGDFDAVIVAHSSFGRIPVAKEFQERVIREQIAELEDAEATMAAQEGKKGRTTKQLAKRRELLQTKLEKLNDTGAKDVGLTFEEIGFDAIVVDEAHEFKNLAFATSMMRVAGLGNPGGSQKAADLYMKVLSTLERTGGRNVIFATGTPLSNTMAEMFTVQRYLDGTALKAMGINVFDAWARVFGEVVSDWELSPSGQYKLNSRFARFVNMPELMQRYLSFADVITNDEIKAMLARQGKKLPLPKVRGGKPENVVVERSDAQAAYIGVGREDENGTLHYPKGSLVWRAENLPKRAEKGADNMLKVMSDARKAALDMRLIDASYGDAPASKVHIAADRMAAIWKKWAGKRGTQLVFIDLSTPKKARAAEEARLRDLIKRSEEGDEAAQEALDAMSPDEFLALDSPFSVYDDLRQKLIDRGVPDTEIAFIHDANTEAQKEELFGKVRSGRVRFLFGSTAKMGAGTNVQNRLVALHHLDAPWRPSDLEQRDGRGIRQGNELYAEDPDGFEIEILRYATKNTLDARQWQTIEGKARFIQQMRKGDVKTRIIEDIAGEAANAAEMKAAASGNPLILEEMELRHRLRKLEGQESEHARDQHRVRDSLRRIRREIDEIDARLPAVGKDAATAAALVEAGITATIDGAKAEKPGEIGKAVLAAVRALDVKGSDGGTIGNAGGFSLRVDRLREDIWALFVDGAEEHTAAEFDKGAADETGLGMRLGNMIRRLQERPQQSAERRAALAGQIAPLERQIAPFGGKGEIDTVRAKHAEVLGQLKPKPKPAAAPAPEAKASIGEPVATITGDELGIAEDAPRADMRKAAFRWYMANLRGSTAVMADGTTVRFNRRGANESTSSKGDTLLRAVPAIRAIIEKGTVVLREPGRDPARVKERIIIAAPVDVLGETLPLAVSVHVGQDGTAHYDFTFDSGARSPGVGVPGEASKAKPSTRSAVVVDGASGLPATAGDFNLFVWRGESNQAGNASTLQDLTGGPLGQFIVPLVSAGKVRMVSRANAPAGWQGWTDPDGTISLLDDLAPGRAQAVLLHEAFHAGVRPLIGDKAWTGLMRRLAAMQRQVARSKGAGRTFYDRALARVERAGATGELAVEEFGAYTIEEYEAAPGALKRWVDDAVGTIKAWALRRFGRQIGQVTPGQLRALAVAALRGSAAPSEPTAASGLLSARIGRLPVEFPDVFHTQLFEAGRRIAETAGIPPAAALRGEYEPPDVDISLLDEASALKGVMGGYVIDGADIVDAAIGYYGAIADEAATAPASKRQIEAPYAVDAERQEDWQRMLRNRSRAWGERLFSIAWHGSPHRFDVFSLAKIGTGEGAQAYGWGLYFAGKKAVAEYYRKNLTKKRADATYRGYTFNDVNVELETAADGEGPSVLGSTNEMWDILEALAMVEEAGSVKDGLTMAERRGRVSAADWIQKHRAEIETKPRGALYTVNIPDDGELLLWDEPLSKQPGGVKDRIEASLTKQVNTSLDRGDEDISRRFDAMLNSDWDEMTGSEFYAALAGALGRDIDVSHHPRGWGATGNANLNVGREPNWRAASEALRAAGIPGHKYLDGGSRRDGAGTYNYVIYDDSRINVLAKASIADTMTPERIAQEVSGKLTDLQPSALALVPFNYFPELAQPGMVAVREYLKVKRLLDAYRGKKHAKADEVAQKWLKYARLGFGGKAKAKAAALADLMHEATLAGIDPSSTDAETRAKGGYDRLRTAYMALPPAGRELFGEVRDAYSRQAEELDRILLDNVRKAQEIAQRRADAEYREAIDKINRSTASVAAKKEAVETATTEYQAKSKRASMSAKARITKLRIVFEASRVEEPYFPLARYGRYFVAVRDVDGTVLSFSRREKAADRNRLAAEMRREYPTATVEVGVIEAAAELRAAMDPRLVAEIESIVGGAGLDANTMSTVLDQIWQRYLQSMPDLSTRKRFIHRKGTAGFDGDALRAFTHHMFHAAHQMGRLKYGMELQELTNEAVDQARKSDDPTRGMTLANELRKRHDWVMNPVGGKVAQQMTSAAFVWFLATSPAAAVVNVTQTPMLGVPILGGRFGVAKAAAALGKASVDIVRGRKHLSQADSAALDAFYESGLIDRTQSHDLAGVGETGVEYSPLRAKVMATMSWMFHRAEVFNREVTALAAFRLARQAGQRAMDAVDTAHDMTWKVHFDYSNSSRARIMQSDTAKVLLVFRAHNINMLYRLFRDAHQAFKGATPQARREARLQLAGIVGMQTLFAGAKGVIGFNLLMALAGLFFGDDDDPLDFETQFQKDVIDVLGPELGGVVLNGVPGHYLGISLTDRLGMPDLWFRSPSRELEGKEEYTYWVQQFLGATVGMGENIYRGVDLVLDGEVARGVEAAAPKWVRDLMKAYRHASEGVTTLRGDEILPAAEIGVWETVAQAIGFTPAKVAETYDRSNALKNAEQRLTTRRQKLVNDFAQAVLAGDKEGRRAATDAIKAFNAEPASRAVAITPDTLRRSLRTRARNAAKRDEGVLIQNERLGRDLREKMPERVYR